MDAVGPISPLIFLCDSTQTLVEHGSARHIDGRKLMPVTMPNTGVCTSCSEPGLMEIAPGAMIVEVTAVTILGVFPMHLAKTYTCSGCGVDTQMCRAGLLQLNCTAPTVADPSTIITLEVISLMGTIEEENSSVSPNHLAKALTVLGKKRRGKVGVMVAEKQLREAMFAVQEVATASKCVTGAYPVYCPSCV
jgi:hypothetical protein